MKFFKELDPSFGQEEKKSKKVTNLVTWIWWGEDMIGLDPTEREIKDRVITNACSYQHLRPSGSSLPQ
jgi:hypothetical protein